LCTSFNRSPTVAKKVVGVFVRFRAPLQPSGDGTTGLHETISVAPAPSDGAAAVVPAGCCSFVQRHAFLVRSYA
jgi:hypothetical protein